MVDIYIRQFWKPTMKELLNFSVRANTPTALSMSVNCAYFANTTGLSVLHLKHCLKPSLSAIPHRLLK